jgi:hypothetical protein
VYGGGVQWDEITHTPNDNLWKNKQQ